MMLCFVIVTGQKLFQIKVKLILTTLKCPRMLFPLTHYSITPILLWFKSRAFLGDKPKTIPGARILYSDFNGILLRKFNHGPHVFHPGALHAGSGGEDKAAGLADGIHEVFAICTDLVGG